MYQIEQAAQLLSLPSETLSLFVKMVKTIPSTGEYIVTPLPVRSKVNLNQLLDSLEREYDRKL